MGVTCQVILRSTFAKDYYKVRAAASRLVQQMNVKNGGYLWKVEQNSALSKKNVMNGALSISKASKNNYTLAFYGYRNPELT